MTKEQRAEQSRRAFALGRAARAEAADERAQRYGQLVRGGYTPTQACWELGVTRRTGHRYADRLKDAASEGTT